MERIRELTDKIRDLDRKIEDYSDSISKKIILLDSEIRSILREIVNREIIPMVTWEISEGGGLFGQLGIVFSELTPINYDLHTRWAELTSRISDDCNSVDSYRLFLVPGKGKELRGRDGHFHDSVGQFRIYFENLKVASDFISEHKLSVRVDKLKRYLRDLDTRRKSVNSFLNNYHSLKK